MRRITGAIVALALGGSLLIGVAVGRMAGGAADESPPFDTTLATTLASTPTHAPLPTLPSVTVSPIASPAVVSDARP